jgi:hypothetical protein
MSPDRRVVELAAYRPQPQGPQRIGIIPALILVRWRLYSALFNIAAGFAWLAWYGSARGR